MSNLAVLAAFGLVLAYLAWHDLWARQIPNRIVLPAIPAALALAPWGPAETYGSALAGLGIGFGALLVIYLPFPASVGAGDVKLAGLLGAMLGYPGVMWGLGIAGIIGGVAALAICKWHKSLPLAPSLVAGAGVMMVRSF